jgi:hypothetical protein
MHCSRRGDGSGEGGPEPALCHPVMSTRCGAACGPKQTASQDRAPACAGPRLRPSRKRCFRLRPLTVTPRLIQRQPGTPVQSARFLGAMSHAPLGSSPETPPTKATSPAPCQLRDSCRLPRPSTLSAQDPAHQQHKPRLLRWAVAEGDRFISPVFLEV